MRSLIASAPLLGAVLAARPFINQPDTGFDDVFADLPAGELPPLDQLVGLHDFDQAAQRHMPIENYTYYRNGAAGEWSYRNNLEVWNRYPLKPRTMVDITNIESTLPTTILGHNFSAPFFISPAARGGYGHVDAEKGLVEGAAAGNILYMPAIYATLSMEEIAAFKTEDQVTFQQVYLDTNNTATEEIFRRITDTNSKAIVFTIDSAADGNRHRAARYGVGSADSSYSLITWDVYDQLRSMTDLPIILKGIQTVEDAQEAVRRGAPAIFLSNHGGRQIDGARSSLEVALDIHRQAPEVFSQLEVYADGGVRYGADVVKLLALGVRAVGLGRPFMYANVYGTEGVARAIEMLKHEIAIDAANAGVADLKNVDPSIMSLVPNWGGA
ncbi:FMN-dependent alpha-hydroxy acid dehydrogenase [Xylariomycetidae sp. FL2044]|nr:FMN-dependent alpha-hydroxy acid dehydrogenase [Xylariomycetidae sp. FL2044]